MTKHTPGPWKAVKLDTTPETPDIFMLGREVPNHWTGIGTFHAGGCERGNPENAANARLIAAAPELLAACEAFIAAYDAEAWPIENDIGLFTQARAAIAKALS